MQIESIDSVPRIRSKAIKGGNTLSIRDSVGLDDHEHNPIRFSVYSASGGKIVEAKLYDEKNDRWISSLHVIDSSENFGEAVGKIVFMEMLKKG